MDSGSSRSKGKGSKAKGPVSTNQNSAQDYISDRTACGPCRSGSHLVPTCGSSGSGSPPSTGCVPKDPESTIRNSAQKHNADGTACGPCGSSSHSVSSSGIERGSSGFPPQSAWVSGKLNFSVGGHSTVVPTEGNSASGAPSAALGSRERKSMEVQENPHVVREIKGIAGSAIQGVEKSSGKSATERGPSGFLPQSAWGSGKLNFSIGRHSIVVPMEGNSASGAPSTASGSGERESMEVKENPHVVRESKGTAGAAIQGIEGSSGKSADEPTGSVILQPSRFNDKQKQMVEGSTPVVINKGLSTSSDYQGYKGNIEEGFDRSRGGSRGGYDHQRGEYDRRPENEGGWNRSRGRGGRGDYGSQRGESDQINALGRSLHKVYMKIQEEMVKMLNEESWDDVKLKYPDSSSLAVLKQFFVAFKKMPKKNVDGVPETFKSFIQKAKFERERRRRVQNVQLDDTLDHYIWNGLDTIQYKVILGDCEKLASIVPKKEYSLVIADIPHGYNIPNIEYDTEPYTYQAFSKVVMGFIEVTTSPFWRFLVFHSDTQQGLVQSSFKGKEKTRRQFIWHKPNIQSSKKESFKHDFESIHLATWTKDDSYNSILVNANDGETPSSILVYNAVVRKLAYEEKDLKGEMVNIYQKPQALINYLIDKFSNEGDWVLDLFSGSGTTLACCLQKGRNCIAIESDPIQCSFIQQRINAIPALPDEMQEVGLRKGDFAESKVAKLSKEPQVPFGGMIGNDHFGELADIKEPMEEQNDTMEAQNDVEEEDDVSVDHDEFGIYDIVD